MSYTILKTDGTTLTSVVDGSIDQTVTDLTLIGKNSTGYGTYFNENFVKLLENFANTNQPSHPLVGQLWFDSSESRLKVYNGAQFVVSGGTIVSGSVPSGIAAGDLWVDTSRQQLFFNDGLSTILAGPLYTSTQGVSGLTVEDVIDINQVNHTVVFLYVNQILLGVFSKDTFTPLNPIVGISGQIVTGFTASSLTGLTFNVPVGSAQSLIAADGTLKLAENFVSTVDSSQTTGTLSIQNVTPLILGPSANTEINVSASLFQITPNTPNQNFQVQVKNNSGTSPGLYINAQSSFVGIYTNNPQATLDVNGDVIVQGSLTVKGNTTIINSTTLKVVDKNIELGTVVSGSPTDTTANGGGLTLKGTTDKTITYSDVTKSWISSEHIELAVLKNFRINGNDVISSTSSNSFTLGIGVNTAPGLRSIGTLDSFQAANVAINGNIISYENPAIGSGNLILKPKGTGSVEMSGATITGVGYPVNATDAASKQYTDARVRIAPLGLSMPIGIRSNSQIAADVLSKMFNLTEHEPNTICRVYGTDDESVRQFSLLGGVWTYQGNV